MNGCLMYELNFAKMILILNSIIFINKLAIGGLFSVFLPSSTVTENSVVGFEPSFSCVGSNDSSNCATPLPNLQTIICSPHWLCHWINFYQHLRRWATCRSGIWRRGRRRCARRRPARARARSLCFDTYEQKNIKNGN